MADLMKATSQYRLFFDCFDPPETVPKQSRTKHAKQLKNMVKQCETVTETVPETTKRPSKEVPFLFRWFRSPLCPRDNVPKCPVLSQCPKGTMVLIKTNGTRIREAQSARCKAVWELEDGSRCKLGQLPGFGNCGGFVT